MNYSEVITFMTCLILIVFTEQQLKAFLQKISTWIDAKFVIESAYLIGSL